MVLAAVNCADWQKNPRLYAMVKGLLADFQIEAFSIYLCIIQPQRAGVLGKGEFLRSQCAVF